MSGLGLLLIKTIEYGTAKIVEKGNVVEKGNIRYGLGFILLKMLK